MKRFFPILLAALALLLLVPTGAWAQSIQMGAQQYARPYNQSGINVFETVKTDTVGYDGFRLYWGAAFTQQFQGLNHSNNADPASAPGTDLVEIGNGFNLATANLLLGAQLADGIRVNLVTYLSSRHHPEAWVKGGYVQADALPMLQSDLVDQVMEYVTIRLGHFEINYGDAHFRRTDNGMALYNPFVGNYILDSFTTEIGGEVYFQHPSGGFAMGAITGGEIKGDVTVSSDPARERAPSFYGKVGFDRQMTPDIRVRLTGSAYTTASSENNTLHGGDRAGSRYYDILVNEDAAGTAFTNGRFNPNFRDAITAFQVNPFVKVQGFEVFGLIETASGRLANETDERTWTQLGADVVYRFFPREQAYVGARYNTVSGPLPFATDDVTITRIAASAGWFATPNLLLKAEYVTQQYDDFPTSDIYHEGEFNGFMVEGVLAF